MKDKTCVPTNTPTTNDTSTKCNGRYYSWECVLSDSENQYLNTPAGASIKTLITVLVDKLANVEQILENNNIT